MARFIENTKEINKAARKQRKPKQQKPKPQKPKQNTSANKPANNKPVVTKTSGNKNKAGGSQYSVKQDRQITSRQTQAQKNNTVNRSTRENTNRATRRYSTDYRNGSQYTVANNTNRRASQDYIKRQNTRYESEKDRLKDSNVVKGVKAATNNDIRRMGGAQYRVDYGSRGNDRVNNLIGGALTRKLGTFETDLGKDSNGYEYEKEHLKDLYVNKKIDKRTYEENLASLERSSKRGEVFKDWKETKAHQIYQELYNKGIETQVKGNKRIEKGMEGLTGIKRDAANALVSGTEMGVDAAAGMVAPFGWALSMGASIIGSSELETRDAVAKGVITEEEARRYAYASASAEVIPELLGAGGMAKLLKGTGKVFGKMLSPVDTIFARIGGKLTNQTIKNLTNSGYNIAKGSIEEGSEEVISGIFQPAAENFAFRNRFAKEGVSNLQGAADSFNAQVNMYIANGYTKEEAIGIVSDYISSDEYLSNLTNTFAKNGFGEKDSKKNAERYQRYLIAHFSGDEKTVQEIEDAVAYENKSHISLSDIRDGVAAAAILTSVTGGIGSAASNIKGKVVKDAISAKVGEDNAATFLAKSAIGLSDKKMAAKASAMYNHAKEGGALSYEQYNELGQALKKQYVENAQNSSYAAFAGIVNSRAESYFANATINTNENGRYVFGMIKNDVDQDGKTVSNFVPGGITNAKAEYTRVKLREIISRIESTNETVVEDKDAFVEELAALECGYATPNVVEYLTDAFPENRAVYEELTGTTLPKDNAKMRDFVYKQSAMNFVQSAKAETIEKIDTDKGFYDVQIANSLGEEGQQTLQALSDNIGVQNAEAYVNYNSLLVKAYESGKDGASIEAVMDLVGDVYNIDKSAVQAMYEAGVADKARGSDVGSVVYDVSDRSKIRNSHRDTLLAFSRIFGVNIVVTDKLTVDKANKIKNKQSIEESDNVGAQVNGVFYGNTIYINLNDDIHKPIGYTIMHELTHGIKQMFPEDYNTFAKLFEDRWKAKKNGKESFDKAIQGKIDAYAKHNITLKETEALEEIICDQMAEVLYDEQFMRNIAENYPSLAQSLLYAIQDVIRKIRQLFANYGGFRSEFNEATLSQLDMLKDAEALLMKAIQAAQDGRTQEMLNNKGMQKSAITYDSLISKAPMTVVNIDANAIDYNNNKAVVDEGRRNALQVGRKDSYGRTVVTVDDTGYDVVVGASGIRHSLSRNTKNGAGNKSAIVGAHIGSLLKNAIKINELKEIPGEHSEADVLLGYGRDTDGNGYLAIITVSRLEQGLNEVKEFYSLYSVRGKKISEGVSQANQAFQGLPSDKITIQSLLDVVNERISDVLPQSVIKHYGIERKQTKQTNYLKFSIDSNGNELSPQQSEYFKDSKVRDENGNLIPVYHGTNADFNTFKHTGSGNYFTANLDYAKNYGGNIRAFYLDIKKPFDVRDKSVREDYVRFVREGFSNFLHPDTKLTNIYKSIENGVDWNEADNLIEWFEENGLDYDGLVLYEGGDLVDGKPVSRGLSYVTLNSNQSKLVGNDNPTSNPDIRFSIDSEASKLTDEISSTGEQLSKGQVEYFKDSKARDENGNLLTLAHGTLSEFYIFDREKGNKEGNFGAGFYATTSVEDVESNYANEDGADYRNKVERSKELYMDNFDDVGIEDRESFQEFLDETETPEPEYEFEVYEEYAEWLAKRDWGSGEPRVMEVYANAKNPCYVGGSKETVLFSPEDIGVSSIDEFDSEDDYYEALDNAAVDYVSNVIYELDGFEHSSDEIEKVLYRAISIDGVTVEALREMIDNDYLGENEDGEYATGELLRQIIEALGYDSIIDYSVSEKFHMDGVNKDTAHVIVFNSNQFKFTDNLTPTDNLDVRFSIVEDSNGEYNVDELETSLKERFKEYETDEENLKLATEVVADIGKIRLSVDGDVGDVRRNTSGIRTIAKGISEQFINEGYIDFRGRKVNGPEDVAAMMQVCRDPRFETFRIILVKGNKVVSVRNMSSRLPGVSVGVESTNVQESFKLMKDRMRRSQADGYYLVHNHPSGKVEASSADKISTAMYINNVRGFKGHIILDHNKYGLIENIPEYDKKSGYTLPKASEVEMGGQLTIDFMNIPEVEHRMLGKSLGNKADSIANTIKQLQTSKTASIVLYADSQLKVREIQEIDNAVIENQKHLKSYIFNEGVRCGARFIFVGAHKFETYSVLREMVKDGVLTDAFLLFDNIDARSARVDDSITPLVSEDDIANNRRLVVYDGTKDYESNSLSEVIPSKESVIKYSFDNPWDTSWFDGMLDDEEVNTRGDKNKSIAEISAEFTNIIRDNAKLTGGKILDRKSIKKQIGELVKMTTKDTTYTATDKREITNFLMDTAEQIWSITGEKRPIKLKQEEIDRILSLLYDASDYVISNAQYINDTMLNEIIEFKKFFRGREVGVSAGARDELADDWDTIRKRNIGRVRFVSAEKHSVTNIADALIQTFPEAPEISLLYGREVEEALEIGDEATLVRILDDVLSNLSIIDDAIKSEYAEDFRVALSQDFARIVLNEGEAWESKMDRFKDRYEQRIKDMRARQKEAVRDMRSKYEKLLAEQNATFKKKLAETKAKSEAKLQAEKDKQKAKDQKRKDSEQRKKIRSRIAEDYNWLAQRLVKPKKDDFKHIPSDFVESIANLLEIFDFQTERSLKLEEKRGYASNATKAMRELKDKISKYSSPDGSNTFIKNDALEALIDECINILDGRPLRELEDYELQKVSDVVRAVKHMVKTQNQLFVDARKAGVAEAGESIISESAEKMKKYGRRYDRTGISGKLSHLLNETMMTPGNFFDSLGGTMKALYKNLRNAQDDYIRKVKFLRDFYKDLLGDYYKKAKPGSAVEDWQTQTNEFTLSDGSRLNITVAQVMSLYCLSKREQALGHILGSGIVLSDVTLDKGVAKVIGGKAQNTASGYRITYNDMMNVISSLSDEQRRIADAIQNLMNTTLKEWGNDTSLKMFDMEFFTEKNYFPISVEQSELATEIGKGTEIKGNRITSFGMTKPLTEHANNKIIIGDIFSIAADHCNKMALYSAYAPALTDFNRVYNYKQRNEDGTTGYSVKGMLKDAYSNKALKFIDNILDDINGQAQPRTDGLTAMINTSLANYKKAAIGLNPRVFVQQPTAIMRALYMINPKYFTPDCFVGLRKTREEMHEHCPIAAWKAWGNYQNDYTKNFEDVMLNKDWSKFDAVTMGAYGWADDMTWTVIWNAVKKEVKQKNPDVEVGSEEYWNLCNERASEIYDETQVVDSVFHRSDAMRNPDKLSKVATSFMAEPTRTYNMVRSSIVKAFRSHKDGDNKAAASELNKMLVVVTLNAAAVSAAAAVIDAFRGKGDDDDDETWVETFYRNFGENFKDNVNMLHNIVFVKDVVSFFENAFEGKYFSPSNMVFEGWVKLAKGTAEYEKVLSGDKTFTQWLSGDFGAGIGYVTGIPTATFIKDAKALWKRLSLPTFASDSVEEDTPSLWDYENNPLEVTDGTWADNVLNFFGINLTPEERAERDFKRTLKEVESKTKDLSGAEKKEAVNKIVMEGYTSLVEDGDFAKLKQMRRIIEAAGGDVEAFDEKVTKRTASEYKKTIGVESDMAKQAEMRQYLLENGWTEAKISGEIVYKSNLAKDFKKACRELDIEKGTDVLTYLILAGITEADAYKLWENRNRGNFDTYSTGKYIAPTNGQITSGFGYRSSPTAGASSYHQGIDIAASRGSVVSAADGGRVVYAGYNGGYGNQIIIQHDDGTQTYYSHLDHISVRKGQSVSQKQYIGNVGSTGISTGPHLDFRVNVGGQFVDPLKYFSV